MDGRLCRLSARLGGDVKRRRGGRESSYRVQTLPFCAGIRHRGRLEEAQVRAEARRRAAGGQRWVAALAMRRLASSARIDRGRKVGALLDEAHSNGAVVLANVVRCREVC